MEHSYHGFFVGPATSSDAADAAIEASKAAGALVLNTRKAGAWIVVERAELAATLAAALGDHTWVWEIELGNEFADEAEQDGGDGHTVTIEGKQWRAGALRERTRDEFKEEGLIRGGVMQDVAMEYVGEYTRIETEADREQGEPIVARPSAIEPPQRRAAGSLPDGSAALVIDRLLERGDLEVVNHHAKRTLIEPIERCLLAPTVAEASAAILAVLEEADEVVEIYAGEAEVEALIAELR